MFLSAQTFFILLLSHLVGKHCKISKYWLVLLSPFLLQIAEENFLHLE